MRKLRITPITPWIKNRTEASEAVERADCSCHKSALLRRNCRIRESWPEREVCRGYGETDAETHCLAVVEAGVRWPVGVENCVMFSRVCEE